LSSATLVLEDGTTFHGERFGAEADAVFELVFNTSMAGYQEILTDPSYAGQLITFTFPHIGNVGTNDEDIETVNMAATKEMTMIQSRILSDPMLRIVLSTFIRPFLPRAKTSSYRIFRRLARNAGSGEPGVGVDRARSLASSSTMRRPAARSLIA